MHLFAPERPSAPGGQKAILVDASPMPHVVAKPLPTGQIRHQVLLQNYDANGGYSYRYVDLHPYEVEQFYRKFYDDPELAFKIYFRWTPQEPQVSREEPKPKADEAQQYAESLL